MSSLSCCAFILFSVCFGFIFNINLEIAFIYRSSFHLFMVYRFPIPNQLKLDDFKLFVLWVRNFPFIRNIVIGQDQTIPQCNDIFN